jgi:hypothetical protein
MIVRIIMHSRLTFTENPAGWFPNLPVIGIAGTPPPVKEAPYCVGNFS